MDDLATWSGATEPRPTGTETRLRPISDLRRPHHTPRRAGGLATGITEFYLGGTTEVHQSDHPGLSKRHLGTGTELPSTTADSSRDFKIGAHRAKEHILQNTQYIRPAKELINLDSGIHRNDEAPSAQEPKKGRGQISPALFNSWCRLVYPLGHGGSLELRHDLFGEHLYGPQDFLVWQSGEPEVAEHVVDAGRLCRFQPLDHHLGRAN